MLLFDDESGLNIILGLGYYHRAYGDIARQNAKYSDALAYYREYMNFARQENHLWSMAQARAKLALAHAYLGRLEQSRQELKIALTEMRHWGKDDLTLQTLLAEPVCLIREGRWEEAIELSAFILNHPVSWNETKQQAKAMLDEAGTRVEAKTLKKAKEQGKNIKIEDMLNLLQ